MAVKRLVSAEIKTLSSALQANLAAHPDHDKLTESSMLHQLQASDLGAEAGDDSAARVRAASSNKSEAGLGKRTVLTMDQAASQCSVWFKEMFQGSNSLTRLIECSAMRSST